MAATGLTDIVAGDPHPLMLRRLGQHPLEQLAVARLQFILAMQGTARRGDPVGEGVANALQILQTGNPRHAGTSGDVGVDGDARECLGGEAGQLVLKATDLTSQLDPREALVTPHLKHRERVSIEQFRHKPKSSVDHGGGAENEEPVKTRVIRAGIRGDGWVGLCGN